MSTSATSDAVTKPLWAPWRLEYIQQAGEQDGCVFCAEAAGELDDTQTLVIHRGGLAFALLNRFPYTGGHLLIAPMAHKAELDLLTAAERDELFDQLIRMERASDLLIHSSLPIHEIDHANHQRVGVGAQPAHALAPDLQRRGAV